MKINRYINFINEEVPYNFEVGVERLKYSDKEWLLIEITDLKNLGAD